MAVRTGFEPVPHLEMATGAVRLVLSDAVVCGLSRANATRRVVSCCPVSANIGALIGNEIGRITRDVLDELVPVRPPKMRSSP